jgi:hypothetical protein
MATNLLTRCSDVTDAPSLLVCGGRELPFCLFSRGSTNGWDKSEIMTTTNVRCSLFFFSFSSVLALNSNTGQFSPNESMIDGTHGTEYLRTGVLPPSILLLSQLSFSLSFYDPRCISQPLHQLSSLRKRDTGIIVLIR